MTVRTEKTVCPYDCPAACALLADTDGERLLAVRGDPDSHTGGLLCRKMQRYERSVYAAGRILTPMRRTGAKGEGKFAPVSWEEAVDEIVRRWKPILEQYGPEAVLPMYYSGTMGIVQRHCGDAFFNRMGACSLIKTLCCTSQNEGYAAVMGATGCLDPRELRSSDFFLLWGSNVKATRLHTMSVLHEARKAGKRVVLVEVYGADMAPYCDEVVLLRPGTDAALALAMMHVLVREGLADEEFLSRESAGWPELRAALGEYTPAWAGALTGIAPETIESLAREFGAAHAPAILLGSGLSRHGNGGMTVRIITILSALTGAWGRPGGGLCGCDPTPEHCVDRDRITRSDFRKNEPRKVNINLLASALADRERPVKSLFVYGGNPVGSVSNQRGVVAGLSREDLFTVVHERFLTDTARYADLLLPATFSVEHSDCYESYGYCSFGVGRRLVPPSGECRSNWNLFRMLAAAMGYDEPHFGRTEDEAVDDLLDHPCSGLAALGPEALAAIRSGGSVSLPFADHRRWGTASGKMEILNPALAEPLPRYMENYGGVYPLRLVAAPSARTLNSIFLERPDLAPPDGVMALVLNPEDAAARGIADADRVIAFNDLGEVAFVARLSPLMARGAAAAVGIHPSGRSGNGCLVNTLCHERLTDLGESTTLNDNTVEVRRAFD